VQFDPGKLLLSGQSILVYFVCAKKSKPLWRRDIDFKRRPLIWLVVPVHCLHQTNVMHRQASSKELENYTKNQENYQPNLLESVAHFALNCLYTCHAIIFPLRK